MATFPALLIGGGLLTLALVVMSYRGGARLGRFLFAALLALLVNSGSAVDAVRRGQIAFYLANAFVYLGAICLLLALLLPRDDCSPPRMPGGMVFVRITVGILLLILGVIGGFIPILQGWIFILLGLLVLFPKAKFTEKVLHKAEPKVPRTVAFLRRFGIGDDQPRP